MKRLLASLAAAVLVSPASASSQQRETYDYWRFDRDMIQHGVQAVLMCNGLFTSNRTLEQVFEQELAHLRQPVGTVRGGDYEVDWDRKAVAIGVPGGTPTMRAAFRKGVGCVVLPPDQTFEDIESLPILKRRPYRATRPRSRGPAATWSRTALFRRMWIAALSPRRPIGRSTASHRSRSP